MVVKKVEVGVLIICLIFAIGLISGSLYAYTIDEVKQKIEFKIIDDDDEPDNYDVLIDARDLKDAEELPYVETSIESAIYNKNTIFDINFLSAKSTNVHEEWNKLSSIVKSIFKVTTYICMALMLTILIYISIKKVNSTIIEDNNIKGKENPKKKLVNKKLVEQWFVTIVLLALASYLINFFVSFSGAFTNLTDTFKLDKDKDTFGVFVKNSEETVYLSSIVGETTDNGSALTGDINSYISGQATKGNWAVYAKNLSNNTESVTYNNSLQMPSASVIKLFIAAAAYEKQNETNDYKVNETDMKNMITVSDNGAANNLIDAVGQSYINSYISKNGYQGTELNRKFGTTSYTKDNYTTASDVGKLLENIYNNSCKGADKILDYMKKQERRSKIPAGITGNVTIANKTGELGSDYKNGPVENDAAIVYKENANYLLVILSSNLENDSEAIENIKEISTRIYTGIDGTSTSDSSDESTTTKTFNYYFKTNLEGLLMFKSQYKWEDNAGENWANMFAGIMVTLFKYFIIYIVLAPRMIIIAILTAILPVMIFINYFQIVRGIKNRVLVKWLKLYLYFLLLRPIIAIIYYILVNSNKYIVCEYPLFILVPIVIITVAYILSLRSMFKRKKS